MKDNSNVKYPAIKNSWLFVWTNKCNSKHTYCSYEVNGVYKLLISWISCRTSPTGSPQLVPRAERAVHQNWGPRFAGLLLRSAHQPHRAALLFQVLQRQLNWATVVRGWAERFLPSWRRLPLRRWSALVHRQHGKRHRLTVGTASFQPSLWPLPTSVGHTVGENLVQRTLSHGCVYFVNSYY